MLVLMVLGSLTDFFAMDELALDGSHPQKLLVALGRSRFRLAVACHLVACKTGMGDPRSLDSSLQLQRANLGLGKPR